MNKIKLFQLGAESFHDSIYFYSQNFIAWTTYNKETGNHTTKHKKISIPSYLNWPFLRCLRMFYAKSQLVGNSPVLFQLAIIVAQLILAFNNYPIWAFFLPFLIWYISLVTFNVSLMMSNWMKKSSPNQPIDNQIEDQMRNHAAEHFVSEMTWFNRPTNYSYGCSNSHIVFWFLINTLLIPFMPITLAYLLSCFISGELVMWLVFNQESWIARLFYPLIKEVQEYTLLEPEEEHIKTATLAMNKLKELESQNGL